MWYSCQWYTAYGKCTTNVAHNRSFYVTGHPELFYIFPWLYKPFTYSGREIYSFCTYCCTSTKFHYLFNFTIFTGPEDALNLICVKYYDIGTSLYALVPLITFV